MTEGRPERPPGQGDGSPGQGPGGLRHQGRIIALQLLYEVDVTDHPLAEGLALDVDDEPPPEEVRRHAERLATGTRAHLAEIDPVIAEVAPAIPVAQLAAVDRNVLRLAIYELLHEPDVPAKAAINEAVELAKRFGGEHSGRFVNGVLGTVLGRLPGRADTAAPPRRRKRRGGAGGSARGGSRTSV